MSSKEEVLALVKSWVTKDQEIRALQKQLRTHKQENKYTTTQLIQVMKDHDIDCFDIKDGKILYKKEHVKKPISKKELLTLLMQYYNRDHDKAIQLNNYLMENRETVVKEKVVFVEDT